MSKVGVVQNLTEKEYVSFTSLDLNQATQAPQQPQPEQQQVAPIIMVAAPEHTADETAPPPPPDITDDQMTTRESSDLTAAPMPLPANGDYVTPPRSAHLTPPPTPVATATPTPTPSDSETLSSNAPRTTFEFDDRLLQVPAVDLSTSIGLFYGGNGDENSTFDPSAASQYSTQIINTVSNPDNLTIYANNPQYFSATEMSRVIELTPLLPSGFNPSAVVISGLPSGFTITGAIYDPVAHSYVIADPTTNGRGDIDLILNYTNLATQSFTVTIAMTATFDTTSGYATPPQQNLIFTTTQGVHVQPVNSAADYTYIDPATGQSDWVLATNTNNNVIEGGNGNLTIYGGLGSNVIVVGNGNNVIHDGAGSDSIVTGTGNNLIYSGAGNETITGGGGTNTVDYSSTSQPISVNLSQVDGNGYATVSVGGGKIDLISGVQNITGGSGNDTFAPGAVSDVFDGGGGSNTIDYSGIGHALTIDLAAGTVNLGNGNFDTLSNIQNVVGTNYGDTIQGAAQPGLLQGGSGNDTFISQGGGYQINGGGGNNTVSYANAQGAINIDLTATPNAQGYIQVQVAGTTADQIQNVENITGSNFNDIITGDANPNVIILGSGNDTVNSGGGGDDVYVGSGSSTINGGSTGTNVLHFENLTGSGIVLNLVAGTSTYAAGGVTTFSGFSVYHGTNQGDTIEEGTASDTILGGTGNDTVYSNTGTHVLDGGGGINTISFANATGAVTVNLNTITAQNTGFGTDTLTNFQVLYGSNYGGTLVASNSGSTIYGGTGGTTVIDGGSGTDALYGGSGANTIVAGSGTETMVAGSGTTAITGGSGTNTITAGGGGVDLITLGSGNTTVTNGGIHDTLSFAALGSAGTIHLDTGTATAGSATDTFTGISNFIGTNHGDTVYDGTGTDSFAGGSGNDTVYTSSGTHTLSGGTGTNTLSFAGASGYTGATAAVNVNLQTGIATGTGVSDTISSFQVLYGSNYGGTLVASNSGSTIYGGTGGTTVIDGGSGTDALYGGSGANTIVAGSGTETMVAGSGTTAITGGSGTNTITAGGGGVDLITLGSGNTTVINGGIHDTLSFAGLGSAGTIHLDTGTATAGSATDTFTGISNFIGTNHGDTVYDGTGTDSFAGGSGNDTVYTSSGTHTLSGGTGTNTLSFAGGGGYAGATAAVNVNLQTGIATGTGVSDTISSFQVLYGSNYGGTLVASNSGSTIYGGTGGTTVIDGGSGTDALYGGSGANTIVAGSGTETMVAGSGTTAITGGSGTNTITAGGGGVDLITLGSGATTVTNGGIHDTLSFVALGSAGTIHLDTGVATVGAATDTFTGVTSFVGTNHGDTVYDSTGTDSYTGGSGNDLVYANTGTHTLNGGAGTNTLSFVNATAAVTVNLTTTTAQNTGFGTDTLTNFQNIVGSGHGDTITGSSSGSVITDSGAGDILNLTAGNNTVTDTGTNDTLSFAGLAAAATIHIATNSATSGTATDTFNGITNFIGTSHGDTVYDGAGTDNYTGGAGNDLVYANTGTHTLNGGAGTNTLSFANATGAVTVNLGLTTAQNTGFGTDTLSNFQVLIDSSHNDMITTGTVATSVYAGSGTDTITGGSGNLTVYAGSGPDIVSGGSGSNTINFSNATTGVTINLATTSAQNTGYDTVTLSNVQNVTGSSHGDTITGTTGNNVIVAGNGTNVIDGHGGSDTITGGSGNDYIVGEGGGSDIINGGGGTNTLDYSNYANALTLNLNTGIVAKNGGSDGNDTISNIQTIYGGQGTNIFTASTTAAHAMHGGLGNNTFIEQNDNYNDSIFGGSGGGTNVLSYANVSSVTASFQGSSGTVAKLAGGIDSVNSVSSLITGSGNDSITADGNALSFFTSVNAGGGNNTVKITDDPTATTGIASKLSTIFTDIQNINLSSMTKSGDSFGTITGDNVLSLLGSNGTVAMTVANGSSLATSIAYGNGTTYTSHTTTVSGAVTTTTWFDASHTHSVILQVTAV